MKCHEMLSANLTALFCNFELVKAIYGVWEDHGDAVQGGVRKEVCAGCLVGSRVSHKFRWS